MLRYSRMLEACQECKRERIMRKPADPLRYQTYIQPDYHAGYGESREAILMRLLLELT
jgi:hypothetical protein